MTSYQIMDQILSHPQTGRASRDELGSVMGEITSANPIISIINNWMLFQNPPKHTRIRKLVSKAFTPRMVRTLIPIMKDIISQLILDIKTNKEDTFDIVTDISYPFPVSIISEMMGIPQEDRHLFKGWSTDFALALALDITALPDELRNRLNNSARDLTRYFEKLIKIKKNDNSDDLISNLLTTTDDTDRLSTAEILSNCALLLVAGHETTTSLISNGMNLLLQHPDQMEILRSDPALIPNAVEEFLRYDPPVQSVGRVLLDDIELDGYHFKKGNHVTCMLGNAGRDPEANPHPEKFDVTRENINHLSFAKGIHYCLGANLARKEAQIVFETILQEFNEIKAYKPGIRNKNWLLRGFASLPVQYR